MQHAQEAGRVISGTLGSLFFPAHCAHCGVALRGEEDFCAECAKGLERLSPPMCNTCSQPFQGRIEDFECPNCAGADFSFEMAVCVVRSRGVVRELLHRLKYGREIWIARVLGGLLREGLSDARLAGRTIDALVPVPLHAVRMREREFNQAALIAGHLSRHAGIPVSDVLKRVRATGTQTRLDRRHRMQNLRNAFTLVKNADVKDKSLLLVDDVLTTGSTLDACASVLLEHGAASVCALTVARG